MILITDLDHTLAASAWRDQYIGDWDTYHALAKNDKPIWPMIALVNSMAQDFKVVCITTRPEYWRRSTNDWLLQNNVKIHDLLMRPHGDFRPSPELKVELARPYWNNSFTPIIAIDDREDVLAAYRTVGIITLLRKM